MITLHSTGKDQRSDKTTKVVDLTFEGEKEVTEKPGPSRPPQTPMGMKKKVNFNFHGTTAGTREGMEGRREQQRGLSAKRRDEDMRTRKDGKRRY